MQPQVAHHDQLSIKSRPTTTPRSTHDQPAHHTQPCATLPPFGSKSDLISTENGHQTATELATSRPTLSSLADCEISHLLSQYSQHYSAAIHAAFCENLGSVSPLFWGLHTFTAPIYVQQIQNRIELLPPWLFSTSIFLPIEFWLSAVISQKFCEGFASTFAFSHFALARNGLSHTQFHICILLDYHTDHICAFLDP